MAVEDFESRFREALRKRLYPHAPLHLKQIAKAIGRSENTLARWWRGETRVLADDLYRLAAFMAERGDRRFLHEIFGELMAGEAVRDELAASVLSVVRAALASSNAQGKLGRDLHTWFDAEGKVMAAPSGHADYVRGALGLRGSGGDLVSYAARVLGWLAMTERSDGALVVRHDGRRVSPLAAERICEWLEDRADQITQVRRSILMDRQWIDAYHRGAEDAATAIAKVAFITHVARRAWQVKLLSLDLVVDQRLKALLQAHRQEPDKLIHAAAAMGAFTTSSLFGVRGDDVISQCVGTDLGFDPRAVEGLNVLSRPDTEYAVMLRARILKAKREGAIYSELRGTIDSFNVRYLNLTLPEPGLDGRVLTSSVVLECEQLAA